MNKTSNNFQLVKITRRYKASFAEMVLVFAFAAIVGYFIETGYSNVVAYSLNGQAVQDLWREAIIIFNSNRKSISIPLPEGSWNVVVDKEKAGIDSLRKANQLIEIPAISAWLSLVGIPNHQATTAQRTIENMAAVNAVNAACELVPKSTMLYMV